MKPLNLLIGTLLLLAISGLNGSLLWGQNPLPFVSQPLVPTAVSPGGPAFTLVVNGTGFVAGSVIKWNGAALSTSFVNASQLRATVPAANIASAGTAFLTVHNPAPGGGTSNVAFFSVSSPIAASQPLSFTGLPLTRQISIYARVVTGDFNGDGKLDLAAADGVQLGNGDGTFRPTSAGFPVIANSQGVAAGDFNADGKLDLAIAISSPPSVAILPGNGDGTFQPPIVTDASPGAPQTIVAADFNGDGKLDLAVTHQLDSSQAGADSGLSVLLGNGDGTFQSPVAFDVMTDVVPNTLAAGDFNRDGVLDLVYAVNSAGQEQITYLQGRGDGTFLSPVRFPAGCVTNELMAADLNGDGKLDLVTTDAMSSLPANTGGACVLMGNGDGTFQSPVAYSSGPSVAFGMSDVNSQGKLDLLMSGQYENQFSLTLGNGDGTFQSNPNCEGSINPQNAVQARALDVVVGDFNGDGRPDLVFLAGSTVDGGGALYVFLQGQHPLANLSPMAVNFAHQQPIGTTSPPQVVTLTNGGGAPLAISAISTNGDFAQTNDCGDALAGGADCTISVTFAPAANDLRTGTLTISDNAVGSPHQLALSGTAPSPAVQFSPTSVSFSSQNVGTTSAAQTVTLTNIGTAPLSIATVVVNGDFGGTDNCVTSSPLAVNGTCVINVTFAPAASGTRSGSIAITGSDGSQFPQTVALSGTGLQAVVSLSPYTLAFTGQDVGIHGPSQTITVYNTGNAPLTISSVQASSGNGPSSFGEINQCAAAIPIGMFCTISVFFDPVTTGSITGTLTLTDDATGSPQTLPLLGAGEDFSLQVGQQSNTSDAISAGQTAAFTLTLTPEGGFSQPVTLACLGAPQDSTCTLSASKVTLNPGAPSTVSLDVATMAPASAAPRKWPGPPAAALKALWSLLCFAAIGALAALRFTAPSRRQNKAFTATAPALLALVLLLGSALLSCGGGGSAPSPGPSAGTPSGTYPLTVVATFYSGTVPLSHNLSLTLKVN